MLPLSVGLQLVRPESIPRNHKFEYIFANSNPEQIDSIFLFFCIFIIHSFFVFLLFILFLFSFFSFC